MKLDIRRLEDNHEGGFTFQMSEPMNPFSFGGDTIRFNSPVEVNGSVKKSGDSYLVSGKIKAIVILKCSRCLKDFPYTLMTAFHQRYEERPDEEEVLRLKGSVINLGHHVLESLILELPMKALCSEECKGFCPICGIDRNKEDCRCSGEDIDPRLISLKKFFEE